MYSIYSLWVSVLISGDWNCVSSTGFVCLSQSWPSSQFSIDFSGSSERGTFSSLRTEQTSRGDAWTGLIFSLSNASSQLVRLLLHKFNFPRNFMIGFEFHVPRFCSNVQHVANGPGTQNCNQTFPLRYIKLKYHADKLPVQVEKEGKCETTRAHNGTTDQFNYIYQLNFQVITVSTSRENWILRRTGYVPVFITAQWYDTMQTWLHSNEMQLF